MSNKHLTLFLRFWLRHLFCWTKCFLEPSQFTTIGGDSAFIMDDFQGEHRFQAAQGRFKTLLPYLIELDQLTRDHPGLLMTPLEDMDVGEDEDDVADFATPIHYLCKFLSSPHLIQSFIDMCPDALTKQGDEGRLPLDVLCSREDVPLETVEALAEKNPEAFQIPDHNGWVPLNAACEEGSMQVVSFLVTRFPETAQMKYNNGTTPRLKLLSF
jgi:hypothetical protein